MTQYDGEKFQPGQEVEVWGEYADSWRQAKVVKLWNSAHGHFDRADDYKVEFSDGTTAVFDERDMRPFEG